MPSLPDSVQAHGQTHQRRKRAPRRVFLTCRRQPTVLWSATPIRSFTEKYQKISVRRREDPAKIPKTRKTNTYRSTATAFGLSAAEKLRGHFFVRPRAEGQSPTGLASIPRVRRSEPERFLHRAGCVSAAAMGGYEPHNAE